MRFPVCLLVSLLCAFPVAASAQTQTPPATPAEPAAETGDTLAQAAEDAVERIERDELRIGISTFPPFVLTGGKPHSGFSIELWRLVAESLDVDYTFVASTGVADKLARLRGDQLDVAIGGITVTTERERLVDFTHPVTDSGLGILVREGEGGGAGFFQRITFNDSKWGLVIGFLALVIVAGNLIWWAERGRESFSDKYFPGVFEGMYWAIVTASTVGYGDKTPTSWRGRAIAGLTIVITLPLFALFTAELASTITVAEIQSRIDGPEDLRDKRVGVVRGTVAADWAAGFGLELVQWDGIGEVYDALDREVVDAVIHDAPSLQYYAQNQGKDDVQVVGGLFQAQSIAFALNEGSPLREPLNRALLSLVESGELERLRVRWFGTGARK